MSESQSNNSLQLPVPQAAPTGRSLLGIIGRWPLRVRQGIAALPLIGTALGIAAVTKATADTSLSAAKIDSTIVNVGANVAEYVSHDVLGFPTFS